MDKQQVSQDIQILEIAQGLVTPSTDYKKLNPAQLSFLSQAYNVFTSNVKEIPSQIADVLSFARFISYKPDIYSKLIEKLRSDSGTTNQEIKKENSSIPAELETMVALYQEHQASLLTGEDISHPVADAVKRARKTWSEHERIKLIFKNAQESQEKDTEKFFSKNIDPKADNREEIEKSLYSVARLALSSQINLLKIKDSSNAKNNIAITKIVQLVESGAIDINNLNDLNIATQLALKDQYGDLNNGLSNIDNLVSEQLSDEEIDPYSDKEDDLNKRIEEIETTANQELKKTTENLKNEIIKNNQDFDIAFIEAGKKANLIRLKLQEAIPNAKLIYQSADPLSQKANDLEKLIRTVNPTALNVHPSGLGAKTSATLNVTGGNTRISATAVDLYSKGLTKEKFQELEKDSRVADFLKNNRTLQKQIEYQLKQISNSPLGKELNSAYKKVSASQKFLDPLGYGRTYINQQIGKQAGELIIKNTSSAAGKKLGDFILKNGLKEGAKKFADEAAKKLIVEAAKQAGVQGAKAAAVAGAESAVAAAAAALGVSTAGLSLIIGAVLIVGTEVFRKIKEGVSELRRSFGYTDKDLENDKRAALAAAALIASSFLVAKSGIGRFAVATQAAVISAAFIIWLAIITIATFLTLTFLTAPILSTFVQLDSVEKVKYNKLIEGSDSAQCDGKTLKNDKMTCRGNYCFPVNDKNTVSYLTYHHNYPANDIMRIGDKPGDGDDVPLPILAYTSGTVYTYDSDGLGGKSIYLAGDDGRFYWYAHNKCNIATDGQKVKAGDLIAGMGSSGNAEGYIEHLHFHIGTRPDLSTVPENYPYFIWPYQDFCKTVGVCGALNPSKYPELPYL